ncbi:hypothetical protein D9615_000772 [Tricholomella constricta]|uniref:NADAR domain-containing protein n=1 Tax=Tricholomella constricta TaxID=117010 RepID=A0A8H5MBK3_9AGAR|nr:hypothetical protein D9615_000772 [Tricholomella constricta]
MGISLSKFKKKRRPRPLQVPKVYYPYDYPYEQGYAPPYWPQPVPHYAYAHPALMPNHGPVIPQAFIPQYPVQMPQPQPQPQPQPYWPPQPPQEPQSKRRKTRRRTPTATITFTTRNRQPQAAPPPAGSAQPMIIPSPEATTPVSSSTSTSTEAPRPSLYAQTPRGPQPGLGAGSSTHHATPSPSRHNHERRNSTQAQPPPQRAVTPNAPPPIPAPFTPTPYRSSNPLPEPPRDIYASSPYKHLLAPKALPTLPTMGQTIVVKGEEPKKPKKGLFGALSRKKSVPQETHEVRYVFVPQGSNANDTYATPSTSSAPPPQTTPAPPPQATPAPPPQPAPAPPPPSTLPSRRESVLSHRTAPEPDPIYFNQDTDYAPFLNHSPHKVCYERVDYPTATHLLEALKFMPRRQDIAEAIRLCDDTADVYEASAEHAADQAPDFGASYLEMMETVVYLKFNQHGDLRDLLLSTEDVPLVYDDPSDSYWGIGVSITGEPGQNQLGHVLEHVRARLQQDRLR